jgi:type VI secretion system protein ImpM
MTTITSSTVGFYGKLPIVGDFVSRRLPESFISTWDNWLQSSILASQEHLGERWLESFLTSPIWRFLLSPGLCGEQAVAGILMPSVDKVGRYFPLTVAVLFEQTDPISTLIHSATPWFEQLEDVALTGLEGQLDLNAFDQLVTIIPPIESQYPSTHKADPNLETNFDVLSIDTSQAYSLWTCPGVDKVESSLIAYQGLPPVGQFFELLQTRSDIGVNKDLNHGELSTTDSAVVVEFGKPEYMSLSSLFSDHIDKEESANLNNTSSWNAWALTNTGLRRKHNEDSILSKPESRLWVVADGMGGHKAGDVASQLIVNTLNELRPVPNLNDYLKAVEKCLKQINTQLLDLGKRDYGQQIVGSTVVAFLVDTNRCAFIWAGDSRLYRFRNNQLQQLTQDHCLDNEGSSEWAVKSSNVITRAVGAGNTLLLDKKIQSVYVSDVFLLCSDGLDKELSHNEIEALMQKNHPKDLAKILMDACLFRGGRDNISIIIITPEVNLMN